MESFQDYNINNNIFILSNYISNIENWLKKTLEP